MIDMNKTKQGIVILGSTGSVGQSTLDVIKENPDRFRVDGLSCFERVDILAEQIQLFRPKMVAVNQGKAEHLKQLLEHSTVELEIYEGNEGYKKLAACPSADKLVAAMVGAAGIEPVMAGIKSKKTIALANKECLVLAGSLLLQTAKEYAVDILPLDSEHNAIFQSLYGEKQKNLEYITLTASGGPFRKKDISEFSNITLEEALKHPNWNMGDKITIDSATMMNKCLEIIEAKWLFDIASEQIKILIHPQSIVHSMVTFKDASTICQMGVPDMRIPIANCLGYPERIPSGVNYLDLSDIGTLTFEAPDFKKFPPLQMAYDVLKLGGGAPAALNGANEVLVDLFLKEEITFTQIFQILKKLVEKLQAIHQNEQIEHYPFIKNIDDIPVALQADQWGRSLAAEFVR